MAPDAASPSLICPLCGASAAPDATYCMACGQPMRLRPTRRSLAPVRIVEAEASALSALSDSAPPAEITPAEVAPVGRTGALTTRLATLAVAAWRQPAVRSVVTTGASAAALSLVWRVAGAALTKGKARRTLLADLTDLTAGEGLAPLVGEALRGATPSKRLRRRGRRGEIVEEVVYIRRIFRR